MDNHMKRCTYFLLLILTIALFNMCSENSPEIKNSFERRKLESICKVWGFLKYYHPGVGTGEINWDDKLLEALKRIDTISNKNQLNGLIHDLIESANEHNNGTVDTLWVL